MASSTQMKEAKRYSCTIHALHAKMKSLEKGVRVTYGVAKKAGAPYLGTLAMLRSSLTLPPSASLIHRDVCQWRRGIPPLRNEGGME
jgi:hypothetical protein